VRDDGRKCRVFLQEPPGSRIRPGNPISIPRSSSKGFPQAVRHAAERGRDQLYVSPVTVRVDARELGGRDADGFVFACKAHQRITHILRLKEHEFTPVFFKAIDPLRATRRLGPVLFQLPPNMKADVALLTAFLEKLPPDIAAPSSFATRPGWWTRCIVCWKALRRVMSRRIGEVRVPEVITAPFVYVRLRKEDYSAEDRQEIGERARRQVADGRDVYIFFKHEDTPAVRCMLRNC
jgi:uncharacterized protein YecE (DUF72 family)